MSDEARKRDATERVAARIMRQAERDGRPITFTEAHRTAVGARERVEAERRDSKPRPVNTGEPHRWPAGFRDIADRRRR